MRIVYQVPRESVRTGAMKTAPKDAVDLQKVYADLKVRNGQYWSAVQAGVSTAGLEPYTEMYVETETEIIVPRHYRLSNARRLEVYDVCPVWPDKPFPYQHNIVLRNDVQKEATNALLVPGDKTLALACGIGKTVCSLYSAAEGKRWPLLVVVHTNTLMGQWRREIAKFYGIEPDEVGHIQGPHAKWEGYPVAMAMLHSLVLKGYPQEFYDYWKLVVFDEAHRLGGVLMMKACELFPGERWSLSATIERADRMHVPLRHHLGVVTYESLKQPLEPQVFFVKTGVTIDESKFRFRRGRSNLPQIMTKLAFLPKRNEQILYWASRLLARGRTILVLGERVGQLFELHEALPFDSKSVHVGQMKQDERDLALTKQIVFATQHLAKEGLDRPAFDTLFILFPFGGEGRLRQSFGRILRVLDGKKAPQVLVFEDNVSVCTALARKMRRHIRTLGYSIKDVNARGSS